MADKNVILHPQGDSSTNIYPKTKQANIIDLDLSDYATKEDLEDKQDVISDLETIRTGAGLGATAVQPSDLPTGEVDLTLTSTSISDGTTTLDVASLIQAAIGDAMEASY